MADYTIPQSPSKRLRYYNNQFLTEKDFIDDQAAHLAHERAQLRALCSPGVWEGLAVTYGAATAPPSIAPGIAVDNQGRLIVLDAAASGPALGSLANGDYLVTVQYNEVATDLSTNTGGAAGAADNTRFTSQPIIAATLKTATLPAGAVVLGSFSVVGSAITAHSDTGRQYSGLRLPGPSTTSPPTVATLRSDGVLRGDGSSDGVLLNGTLAVRRDLAAGLGATLTLTNGVAAPGTTTASAALDLNTYDPGANAPAVRLQALGDGSSSGHLVISTKAPGAQANALVERLRITSAGVLQVAAGGSLSVPALTCPSITGAVAFDTSIKVGTVGTAVAINRFTSEPIAGMADVDRQTTVPTGSAVKVYVDGVASASSGRLLAVQVLTTGAITLTPAAGARRVRVRMIGGGGGGGAGVVTTTAASTVAAGAGGSSGVVLEAWIVPTDALSYGTYSLGTGGAGGTSAAADGLVGGDTTITINGQVYTAKGGAGGQGMTTSSPTAITTALARTPASSTVPSPGIAVRSGVYGPGGNGYIFTGVRIAGAGGSSEFGAGGLKGNNGPGASGAGPGGGGGGGEGGVGSNQAGGAGAAGCIVIEEYS